MTEEAFLGPGGLFECQGLIGSQETKAATQKLAGGAANESSVAMYQPPPTIVEASRFGDDR